MKRAVILHAMEQDASGHWYPWLNELLEAKGYEVWVPNIPSPDHPGTEEMTDFLLSSGWDFNKNLLIRHSSGSVEVLYLLQALPENVKVDTAVVVSSFDRPVPGMESQHDRVFTKDFDFKKIKQSANHILFMHGRDDPWFPLEGAQSLADSTDGELIIVDNGGHFSTSLSPRYDKFPELIDELEARKLV